ncbi:hypothetical protein I4B36_004212 [Enterobacter hormaechei]|nr:hypothetical protein [Enterobacter hormaechei]
MSDKKYGVFFWRKGERVEDVPSDQNVANRGVKPKRIFTDYIEAMRYAGKLNATIPGNLKGKYEYVLNVIVKPDKNGTKELFKSGNLTEALKVKRQTNEQINRNKIDAMIKEGIQEHLYKMTGVK